MTFEQEEKCKDGSTVWTEVRASLVMDENNKPIGMMGCTRDITDRKHLQEALRLGEQQFLHLLDALPLPIAIHRDGKYIHVNPAALKLFGASHADQVSGKDVLDLIEPDTRESFAQAMERLDGAPDEEQRGKCRVVGLDGRTADVEAMMMTVRVAGELCQMVIYE
jgi:PAS domain S-box-containing protein